ncbi:MAG: FIST C-terminal domain-containing protein [Bdellovibrionales bacterium]|nr:FIST C-terminal domain-containing protein [Bdellovibrionales bacterium]
MTNTDSKFSRIAQSSSLDPEKAIRDIAGGLQCKESDTVLFYCSSQYDLQTMAQCIRSQLPQQCVGCTTAGEISGDYSKRSIVAVGLPSEYFQIETVLVPELASNESAEIEKLKGKFDGWKEDPSSFPAGNRFVLLLIDGLSVMEEVFLGKLSTLLGNIPLVGGSAGDDLTFSKTYVYADGQFHTDAAVLALVETNLKVEPFRFQHFRPSARDMVITSADPRTRIVYEIDGSPAAEEYARILGLPITDLTPQVFSTYPVMLQIGQHWYVRSIQKVNEDGSLTFYCAIDEGLPLTIAEGIDFVETLSDQVDKLKNEFSRIDLTLGFDCILRRLEIEQKALQEQTQDVLRKIQFFGFSTYGEQYNTIHVNQTLTGVALGEGK